MRLLDFAKVSMMTEFMILGIDHIFTVGFESEGKWLNKRGFFKDDIEIIKQYAVTFEDTTGGSHPLVMLVLNHFPEEYDYDTDGLMETESYILNQLERHINTMKQLVRHNQAFKEDEKNENVEVDDMIKIIRYINEMTSSIVYNITNDERLIKLLFSMWECIKSRKRGDGQYSVMLVFLRDIVSRLVDGRYGYKLVKVDEES